MTHMNRRTFLASAAAASAAAASTVVAAPSASAAEVTTESHHWGDVRLAVATYSLRKFSRAQAINIIKDLGIKYINVKSVHMDYELSERRLAAARKEFERGGLEIVSGGNVGLRKDDDDDVHYHFKYAKNAGIPVMVCAPTHKNLPIVEKYAIKYDIKVAIHNHGPEDEFYPAPSDVLKRVKNMDLRMGLCIDVGHTVRTGADILEEIAATKDRTYDFHMKDLASFTDKSSQVDVGDGKMPVAAIFRLLKKNGYLGVVGLEYEINSDAPQLGMAKSFSYMRGVLDGQAG